MEIPAVGPSELELSAVGLVPASIQISEQEKLSLDTLFRSIADDHDLSRGLTITGSVPNTVTIDGVRHDDCHVLYMKDDCAVAEYAREDGTGRINIVVFRQDVVDIVRPIQLVPDYPIAGSVNAFDIVAKFQAADAVLQATKSIVDDN